MGLQIPWLQPYSVAPAGQCSQSLTRPGKPGLHRRCLKTSFAVAIRLVVLVTPLESGVGMDARYDGPHARIYQMDASQGMHRNLRLCYSSERVSKGRFRIGMNGASPFPSCRDPTQLFWARGPNILIGSVGHHLAELMGSPVPGSSITANRPAGFLPSNDPPAPAAHRHARWNRQTAPRPKQPRGKFVSPKNDGRNRAHCNVDAFIVHVGR